MCGQQYSGIRRTLVGSQVPPLSLLQNGQEVIDDERIAELMRGERARSIRGASAGYASRYLVPDRIAERQE